MKRKTYRQNLTVIDTLKNPVHRRGKLRPYYCSPFFLDMSTQYLLLAKIEHIIGAL
ncbi:hypothetical protein AALA36_03510 [Lachnospiraceae bacterium 66-29]